jgi:hypothetical protein
VVGILSVKSLLSCSCVGGLSETVRHRTKASLPSSAWRFVRDGIREKGVCYQSLLGITAILAGVGAGGSF